MIVIHESKFLSCKTAKDLYAATDRLGVLSGITIDQRKLMVCICNQIDQGKSGNPVVLDIKTLSEEYMLPGLTSKNLLAMAIFLSQKMFWIQRENGNISLVRIFSKINAQRSTFRFYLDNELLALRKPS